MKTLNATDEKALLQQLRDGDGTAFTAIYNTYYGTLYLHAYNRLRNREIAQDIVHDLFTNLWSKKTQLTISEGLSSYLYTAIRNRIIDYVSRQESSSRYIQSLGNYLEQNRDTPDLKVEAQELAAMIEKEIAALSPQLRIVFELSRNEHLSHKEIAIKLNLSEQTVRGYIKNALRTLRVKFGTYFFLAIYLVQKLF